MLREGDRALRLQRVCLNRISDKQWPGQAWTGLARWAVWRGWFTGDVD